MSKSIDASSPDNARPHARGGLIDLLGIEVAEATAERVVAIMPVTSNHHQPYGYLHGGATVALAETAASIGANLASPDSHAAFGMEINANHLRPVRAGRLHAEALPLHVGRTSQVWEVKVRDEQDRLICVSRCTLAVTPRR